MDQPLPQQQSPHQGQRGPDDQTIALSRQVADMLSRLRLMEERYANLRREHQLTSQNMIENHQGLSKQQRKFSDTIVDFKRTLQDLREQLDVMEGELSGAANVHELKTLERYLDLWQPLDFLTRGEADRLIKEAQREKVFKSPDPRREEGT